MSPAPFAQQVSYLIDTLSSCETHCNNIRLNRSLGSKTINLDNLQSSLTASVVAIESRFATLERLLGSQIQLGDDISRNALNRSIRELEFDIETRLNDISNRKERAKGSGDEKVKKMGFGIMNEKVLRIEGEVVYLLDDLARRVETSQQHQQQQQQQYPEPLPQQKKQHHEEDEAVISLQELGVLVQHLKNSWIEKNVNGRILYVNCFDDKVSQWDMPEGGFIRSLPRTKKSDSEKRERVREEEEAEEERRRRKQKKERREKEKREKEAKEEREAEEKERLLREQAEREFLEREMREREKEREREAFEREAREKEFRERERLRRMEEEQYQQRRSRARPDFWQGQRGW
jgi:hypothetical protein